MAFAASASASAWAFACASAFRLAMAALVACDHCDAAGTEIIGITQQTIGFL
jgi:hypothetical protein